MKQHFTAGRYLSLWLSIKVNSTQHERVPRSAQKIKTNTMSAMKCTKLYLCKESSTAQELGHQGIDEYYYFGIFVWFWRPLFVVTSDPSNSWVADGEFFWSRLHWGTIQIVIKFLPKSSPFPLRDTVLRNLLSVLHSAVCAKHWKEHLHLHSHNVQNLLENKSLPPFSKLLSFAEGCQCSQSQQPSSLRWRTTLRQLRPTLHTNHVAT